MTELGHVELQGKDKTNPFIPSRNIKGTLHLEEAAVLFKSDSFQLIMPYNNIRECHEDSETISYLRLLTYGFAGLYTHNVRIRWNDSKNNVTTDIFFKVLNWMGGDTHTEGKAKDIANKIWVEKAAFLRRVGSATIIRSKDE